MFLYSYDSSVYQYTICGKLGSFDNSECPIAALIEVGVKKVCFAHKKNAS